jgi:hypothetical protein
MRFRSRTPPRSNPVRVLLGTFLILTVSAATDAVAAGTWSTTGSMTAARSTTATLLTDGRVLAAGGCGAFDIFDDCLTVLASAELYNPATGTWSATGSMSVARWFHTATRLLDGRVLVAGGFDSAFANLTSAELYDPATGTWSPTGSTSVGRFGFIATLLLDGRVLVAGGGANGTSAELYDPITGTWSATGSTSFLFSGPATLLMDGKVLVVARFGTSAALYDPATGTWSATGSTSFGSFVTATLLQDGRVLVAGGGGFEGGGVELYDPTTGMWSVAGGTLACCHPTATLLQDGRVLGTGGSPDAPWAAELFTLDPQGPLFAAVLPTSRSVAVGMPATAFATIINTGTSTATGCQIVPGTTLPASFAFQTTNPTTNALTGTVNTPADIPAKGAQTFMFAFTPTAAIAPTDVRLNFVCANATAAPIVSGVDTFLLSASTTPGPDVLAVSATLTNNGIVDIPGTTGTGIFSVAAMNLGIDGTIAVSADMGAADLPVRIALCQTDPMTGQCVNPTVPTTNPVAITINANEMPTFGIFVTGTSTVSFAPALNRIFVRFTDAGGLARGSTSVAARTQ